MTNTVPRYDVYKWRGAECQLLASGLHAEEAARLIDVDTNDLSAAVDEHGRCDCGRYVAVGAGDERPEKIK